MFRSFMKISDSPIQDIGNKGDNSHKRPALKKTQIYSLASSCVVWCKEKTLCPVVRILYT